MWFTVGDLVSDLIFLDNDEATEFELNSSIEGQTFLVPIITCDATMGRNSAPLALTVMLDEWTPVRTYLKVQYIRPYCETCVLGKH